MEVHYVFGTPSYSCHEYDQYLLNETLVLALIYDTDEKDQLIIASFGSRRIFSNNTLRPNRLSLIFESMNINPR